MHVRLDKQGWLEVLVRQVVATHRPESVRVPPGLQSGRARARAHLQWMLRESGLLYGTPVTAAGARGDRENAAELLFLTVLEALCRLALDLAVLLDGAPGPRPEQLLLLFAALSHQLDEAEDIHARIEHAWRSWPVPDALWERVERALATRAPSLASDPYYGLVLHNGALYADAYLLGRLAIAYFSQHTFPRSAVERRLAMAATQKARLLEVLVGLACAERKPGFQVRRAILRQIDGLQLPELLASSTRASARRAFERAPSIEQLTRGVRSRALKRFIVEQTVLASLVEGRRSPREVQWTHSLAAELGFTPEALRQLEVSMADFYRRHRGVIDVFTVTGGADVMGEEWIDKLSTMVRKNSRAVLKEIRKTGEVSVLLARAARGLALNPEEKRQLKEQLLDVVRAVPALAIFAAPGGALLLLALSRVLPPKLLPSSFWEDEGAEKTSDEAPRDGG